MRWYNQTGGAPQIYHLKLLQAWREAETATMVSLVNKRDELGLEVPNSNISASKNSHRILVRQFLGLAGYYHRFVPGFVDPIISLIDLTRKEAPELVQWL